MRTSQELKSNKKEVELYGGGRISEGNADVMELGHSKEYSIEAPRNNLTAGSKGSKTILNFHTTERFMPSGSGEGSELFKFGDEDLVTRKPIIIEMGEISSEPQ